MSNLCGESEGGAEPMSDEKAKDELHRAALDATNYLRQARYSQEMSAIRSLQVVDAGGSVALLTFLGQTWGAAPALTTALVAAVGLMVVGLMLAVWGGFQLPDFFERGYRQSEPGHASEKYRRTRLLYGWTIGLSFAAFVFAVFCVLLRVVLVSSLS
jgi:hypothetical protein